VRLTRRSASCALLAAGLVVLAACSRQDARLQQHKEKFESLGATTQAIAQGWLSGALSGTYTRTAFAQTLQLVEQERTALAAGPEMLLDPRGATLSQQAEQLSRLLAKLIGDVRAADAPAARRDIAAIPIAPDRR
jgi:hypothetical protein